MASRMCDGFSEDCNDKSDEDGEICQEWDCLEGKMLHNYVQLHLSSNYMKLMINQEML